MCFTVSDYSVVGIDIYHENSKKHCKFLNKKLGKMQIIVKYVNSKKNTKFASLKFLILVEC